MHAAAEGQVREGHLAVLSARLRGALGVERLRRGPVPLHAVRVGWAHGDVQARRDREGARQRRVQAQRLLDGPAQLWQVLQALVAGHLRVAPTLLAQAVLPRRGASSERDSTGTGTTRFIQQADVPTDSAVT
jgi:hypothetical protein